MSKWIHASASAIGNSHISNQTPCQDFARVVEESDFLISVVCDGAGSAEMSHIGAKETSAFAIYYLVDFFSKNKKEILLKKIEENKNFWQNESTKIVKNIKKDIENFAINEDIPLKSLACTLIAVIAYEDMLLVMHIGDGRAGYCDNSENWHALMTPFRGEEANETVFLVSDFWDNVDNLPHFIRTNIVHFPPEKPALSAFCLMSDGCEKASFLCNLYDEEKEMFYDPNLPYPPFFNPNVKVLQNLHLQNLTQTEINALWEKFLTAGNDKLKNEPDDKTLVLAVKKV